MDPHLVRVRVVDSLPFLSLAGTPDVTIGGTRSRSFGCSLERGQRGVLVGGGCAGLPFPFAWRRSKSASLCTSRSQRLRGFVGTTLNCSRRTPSDRRPQTGISIGTWEGTIGIEDDEGMFWIQERSSCILHGRLSVRATRRRSNPLFLMGRLLSRGSGCNLASSMEVTDCARFLLQ